MWMKNANQEMSSREDLDYKSVWGQEECGMLK